MLKVLKSGFYTTVQDEGRFGLRDKGVPVSGAMDTQSLIRANSLLENPTDAAGLEITMTGPTLVFEEPTHICLGGAALSATLNNDPIENYKVYRISAGDILSYGRLEKGFRGYLAVKGGLLGEKILGSRSQYMPLTKSKCIADQTEIEYGPSADFEPKITELKAKSNFSADGLQVQPAPEYGLLDAAQLEKLYNDVFTISKENTRMAYQFNETIGTHSMSMLTSATLPGTVQLTPSGKIIILMKDGQTTGGYPRVLQLSEEAICLLAQKKFGDAIRFVHS